MKEKKLQRFCLPFLLTAALAVCLTGPALTAEAYYNRGTVTVTPEAETITLTEGESISISVTTDPVSSDQTEGCGMEECPQTCGTGCMDANGNCTCAGSSCTTYYTEISLSVSDNSVIEASYSDGILTIEALNTGSSEIELTGSLREYTSGTASVSVAVEAAEDDTTETEDTAGQEDTADSEDTAGSEDAADAEDTTGAGDAADPEDTTDQADDSTVSETGGTDEGDTAVTKGGSTAAVKKPVIQKLKSGKKKLTVKWSNAKAKKYKIYYRVKNTKKWKVKTTTKRRIILKNLKSGKKYQVKVKAIRGSSKKVSKVKTSKKIK